MIKIHIGFRVDQKHNKHKHGIHLYMSCYCTRDLALVLCVYFIMKIHVFLHSFQFCGVGLLVERDGMVEAKVKPYYIL